MSSLRNAVQRRNHRERAQPAEREKWGLLEKRKDYKLRAADHKTKQKKISALKQKASERNEDEFYFGMVNSSTQKGIKQTRRGEGNGGGSANLDPDVVKLMKTQDRGYLQTVLQKTRNERERLEREVVAAEVGVDLRPAKAKVVFGEDGEELATVKPVAHEEDEDMLDMDLDDLMSDEGDVGGAQEDDDKDLTPAQRIAKKRKRHTLEVKQRKLEALKEQEEKLSAALEEVDHQRAKMNGTTGGVNKNGVAFKARQRKR